MSIDTASPPGFSALSLSAPVLKALEDVGYEQPSPIQAQTIPHLLAGRDVLGQAQTGTGKTAAFALPILSRIDLKRQETQALVLTPTRELAIQVAEAFQRYAAHLKGFHVLPIYGGQDYGTQLRALRRGAHVVVGTPGRVMDHMRRETLNLGALATLVLDEADEMLRMGFIDDVQWILEQTPPERQVALFSATMPEVIKRIAQRHLKDPQEIRIKVKTATAETIRQRYWMVSGLHKLDALTRILEAETFDGMIVFVRTKTATLELAEKLEARGHACAALNGDIPQKQRERTVEQLKQGKLDILVATDVAARGLDVERVSHIINYDIPYDAETYVHRIGRTGRAGRSGDAILFVSPRERNMLRVIEKATRQPIEPMQLPSTEAINDRRVARFLQRITDTLAAEGLDVYQRLIEQYHREHDVPALEIAAALARLVQGDSPLLLETPPKRAKESFERQAPEGKPKRGKEDFARETPEGKAHKGERPAKKKPSAPPEEGMERYRIEVGHAHGVMPGNIVGAIANEAGLDSQFIGRIDIHDDHSTVDLPEGMPREIFRALKAAWVCGQRLQISRLEAAGPAHRDRPDRKEQVRPEGRDKKEKKEKKEKRERKEKKAGKGQRPRPAK